MTDTHWSYDGESFETHPNEAAAIKSAEAAIEYFREGASEGWAEEVEQVVWGVICGHVVMVDRKDHSADCAAKECAEDCEVRNPDWSHSCGYELKAVE